MDDAGGRFKPPSGAESAEFSRLGIVDACLRARVGHPAVVTWFANALYSINERLAGREGVDLKPLGSDFAEDALDILMKRSENKTDDQSQLAEMFGME